MKNTTSLAATRKKRSRAPPPPSSGGQERSNNNINNSSNDDDDSTARDGGMLTAAAAAAAAAADEDEDENDNDDDDDTIAPPADPSSSHYSTTNFRSVSACNRCRGRKNRCDQRLPRCSGCAKANVACVGFDPVGKRPIPRSYVCYLENRVRSLEAVLSASRLAIPPPEPDFAVHESVGLGAAMGAGMLKGESGGDEALVLDPELSAGGHGGDDEEEGKREQEENLQSLVGGVGMVSVRGVADAKKERDPTSRISFARVVFAAVKSSVPNVLSSDGGGEGGGRTSRRLVPESTSTSDASGPGQSSPTKDSFFGLTTRPAINPAPFPDKQLGHRLVKLYFEHANPQIPILHRGEFMSLFDRVYAAEPKRRTPRELYLLNIVFAIGSGIIMDSPNAEQSVTATETAGGNARSSPPTKKKQKLANPQRQPEEYHSSAIVHLENFLGSTPTAGDGAVGGLEELQAVLLLAGLALLRPVAPGLWYIVGVALRLAVDLGLHSEDVDAKLDDSMAYGGGVSDGRKSLGRKQWSRDLRRRLWWCVYAFDRLVSSCVGRPVGIPDQLVTTEFPSLLDDKYITTSGFLRPSEGEDLPSYKLVAQHYLRLRLLQSEILQVLQHRHAEQARVLGANGENAFMHTDLSSPFLLKFHSFRDWRSDVDRRLWEWKESVPKQSDTGVAFTPLFLELNYWQALILLYRPSLSVPEALESEIAKPTGEDMLSPGRITQEEVKEDEQMVFMKVAQAGQTVLKLYRQLHRLKLVNYTFLATHHLFMSGISFLNGIWHSPLVRSQLTLDDVDFTVLIATSVLADLSDKCPPAEACRDAFARMSKATIAMVEKTTGFGNASTLGSQLLSSPVAHHSAFKTQRAEDDSHMADEIMPYSSQPRQRRITMPKFDMNLKDLFSDDEIATYHSQPATHAFVPRQKQYVIPNAPGSTLDGKRTITHASDTISNIASDATMSDNDLAFPVYHQQQQQPHHHTNYPSDPVLSDLNLDFLNEPPFSNTDTTLATPQLWDPAISTGDFDFNFGGGAGVDINGHWDPNGVDMLGGYFFGENSGGF